MKINYLNNPMLPITVTLIGAGGNGSQMLMQLGRINHALLALGKPGLLVEMIDGDKVSESNIGRQLFSEGDIGEYKANVLISRINRYYGLNWQSSNTNFTAAAGFDKTNVIITCTDNVESRLQVAKFIRAVDRRRSTGHEYVFHYWIDMGNGKNTGQVIMGSPKYKLPTVIDIFPNAKKMEVKDDTPSCSLAEALSKQDLFINPFVSGVAAKLFWECCTQAEVNWSGAYINLNTLNFKKIPA